jgi:hypothetical protein
MQEQTRRFGGVAGNHVADLVAATATPRTRCRAPSPTTSRRGRLRLLPPRQGGQPILRVRARRHRGQVLPAGPGRPARGAAGDRRRQLQRVPHAGHPGLDPGRLRHQGDRRAVIRTHVNPAAHVSHPALVAACGERWQADKSRLAGGGHQVVDKTAHQVGGTAGGLAPTSSAATNDSTAAPAFPGPPLATAAWRHITSNPVRYQRRAGQARIARVTAAVCAFARGRLIAQRPGKRWSQRCAQLSVVNGVRWRPAGADPA